MRLASQTSGKTHQNVSKHNSLEIDGSSRVRNEANLIFGERTMTRSWRMGNKVVKEYAMVGLLVS
jgi:hypothetical protein